MKTQLDGVASQLSAAKENVINTQATLAIAQAELEKGQVQLAVASGFADQNSCATSTRN